MNIFEFSCVDEGFDTHIRNSIPGYDSLLKQTVILSNHWLSDQPDSKVIDIGGSTGNLLSSIQKMYEIESKEKLINLDPTDFVQVSDKITYMKQPSSFLTTFDWKYTSVELFFSIFTLQFMSSEERATTLKCISEILKDDGAFIVAEKFFLEQSEHQELFSVVLRELKRSNFSDKDILDKDIKLLKHLNLKTEQQFLNEMRHYGFVATKYWQNLHFNAFICTKVKPWI